MVDDNKIRWLIIGFFLTLACAWMVPNFYSFKENQWWFSKEKLIYGLDIQGGLHIVMGVKVDDAIQEKMSSFTAELKNVLESSDIKLNNVSISEDQTGQIIIVLNNPEDHDKAKEVLKKKYIASLLGQMPLRLLRSSGKTLVLGYNELELIRLRKSVVAQVVEVIRRRIDEFGVSEPVITSQGTDRVLVQLPGVQDSARARDIIQKTAKLEIRLLNDEFDKIKLLELIRAAEKKGSYKLSKELSYLQYIKRINKDLKGQIPKDHMLLFQRASQSKSLMSGKVPVLVRTDSGVGGEIIQTAFVTLNEFGQPQVAFHVDVTGRKVFSELTGNNIGKALAIILDKEIKSSAVIRSRIPDRGQIDNVGSPGDNGEEAETIATLLRAGSLPATLFKMEERTVGPTLGRDSIQKGKVAGLIACIAVVLFMFVYYRVLGLIANVALCMNMVFLLALLSSLGATVTLPGVAGIILTIGMAVDANVIIYERLKEELRKGSDIILAIRDGYRYALSAILDANITTAIVCMILMSFGTGPIRGFAVTLFCGIITSLFTAIFVSRTLLNSLVRIFKLKTL